MLCCILPLLLNIIPQTCLLVFFSFSWFGLVLLPSPFPSTSLRCVHLIPLQPAHATSEKPQTQNPSFVPCRSSTSPSAYLSTRRAHVLSGLLCALLCPSARVSSEEAFPLWCLSTPSLRAMKNCGLCYQYFNFYQYGVWLIMIHGFRPSIQ